MNNLFRIILLVFLALIQVNILLAGPGGAIAKSITDTKIGKIIAIVLMVILFPFILYSYFKDTIAYRKTAADLKKLGMKDRRFQWLTMKTRFTDIYSRVHRAWDKKDMAEVSEFMTDWYWQNQQIVHLDKWESKGLVNICNVREITDLKPLFVQTSNESEMEGSRVVVSIDAEMEDYLLRKSDETIVEGIKGYKSRTTVWTFTLEEGKWKVENIEAVSFLSQYLKMDNEILTKPVTA